MLSHHFTEFLCLNYKELHGIVPYGNLINFKLFKSMDLRKIANQAQEKATEAAAAAQEKIDAILDEFNRMLPFVEELGLRVSSFDIEAGLLPQIKTSLIGSVDDIKSETVERLIAENETNKLLGAVLSAVLMAKSIHERLEGAYISVLKDLVIDIKLGVPPSITCRFK